MLCWPSRCWSIDAIAGEPLSWELALTLVALTAFMVGFAGNVRLNIELRHTREQLAVAAVAAERERIGRDLHDILGHSLTAIAVKAGLARRLLDRDPAAAGHRDRRRRAVGPGGAEGRPGHRVRLSGGLAGRRAGRCRRRCCGRPASAPTLPQAVDDVDPAAAGGRSATWCGRRSPTSSGIPEPRTCRDQPSARGSIEIVDDGSDGAAGPAVQGRRACAVWPTGSPSAGGTLAAGPQPAAGSWSASRDARQPAGSAPTPLAIA